jgi:hypothetical protein
MACKKIAFLLWVQALLGGVLGGVPLEQGMVTWEMGMFGVTEGEGSVEVCAIYAEAVEGFAIETSTTEISATDGSDYQSLNGTAAQLVWTANSTRACITIPILDDETVENDEVFFVNMVRIVTPFSNPTLALSTIVMIMNDDVIQVVFTSDDMTVTDDVGTIEACVGVSSEQVNEGVQYRIPIIAETVDGTAVSDKDFEPLNNVTSGDGNSAVLTPINPERCFPVTILARTDDGLDDRNFFVSVRLREGGRIEPSADLVSAPTSDLEVTIQPSAQIEPGDILDMVLSNPLFSVSLDMTGGESDSNLCYEVHGERSRSLNLVSDVCFSINARYEEIEGTSNNKIDEVAIRTSDASNNCIDILIDSGDDCAIALLRTGTEFESLTRRYRRNGIQIDFVSGSIEILLPCARYPGGGIRVVVKCLSEFEDLFTESILPVKNLQVVFNRAKLPESTTPMPHGLLGQFWHLQFHQEEFAGEFNRGGTREGTVQITTPSDLGSRSFISLHHPLTWDRREETCYYAGSKQAGATDYIPAPEDTIIEGGYTDYMVDHNFDTEFTFSVFSSEDFGCPSTSSLLTRSIQ